MSTGDAILKWEAETSAPKSPASALLLSETGLGFSLSFNVYANGDAWECDLCLSGPSSDHDQIIWRSFRTTKDGAKFACEALAHDMFSQCQGGARP